MAGGGRRTHLDHGGATEEVNCSYLLPLSHLVDVKPNIPDPSDTGDIVGRTPLSLLLWANPGDGLERTMYHASNASSTFPQRAFSTTKRSVRGPRWTTAPAKKGTATILPTEETLWRHDMEMISSSLAICEENPLVTGGFPLQIANNMKH